jgi:tryptophan synthase alpha chain
VLCVDLPPEEAVEYKRLLDARDIATIFLIAPTSSAARIDLIAANSTGFLYYVSRTGVTGERSEVETSVQEMVERIKGKTTIPVAVGFGIGTPEQAAEVGRYADGVIVGSAIVRMIGQYGDSPDTPGRVGAFAKKLADAAKGK